MHFSTRATSTCVSFGCLQTTTTNHLYSCRRFNDCYFVTCTSSINFKLSTLLQAVRLRLYADRCSLRLWRQSTFAYCSQGVPQIFTAAVYRAHCAVIFAIAQLSCLLIFLATTLLHAAARHVRDCGSAASAAAAAAAVDSALGNLLIKN